MVAVEDDAVTFSLPKIFTSLPLMGENTATDAVPDTGH